MKRIIFLALTAIVLPGLVGAAEVKPFILANLGMVRTGIGSGNGTSSGLAVGGGAGFNVGYFGTSFRVLTLRADTKLTPMMFNFYGRMPLGESTVARFGGGFSHVQVSTENQLLQIKSGLGYNLGGGVDFFVSENVSIGADIMYLFFNGTAERSTYSERLDSLILLSGATYHF